MSRKGPKWKVKKEVTAVVVVFSLVPRDIKRGQPPRYFTKRKSGVHLCGVSPGETKGWTISTPGDEVLEDDAF